MRQVRSALTADRPRVDPRERREPRERSWLGGSRVQGSGARERAPVTVHWKSGFFQPFGATSSGDGFSRDT